MARNTKYEGDRTIALAQGYAMEGMTDAEIAGKLHIGVRTFYDWAARYPQFSQAIKTGKEQTDFEVEQSLLKKAMGGDTVACIFWLKNRKPNRWRDRPKADEMETDDSMAALLKIFQQARRPDV